MAVLGTFCILAAGCQAPPSPTLGAWRVATATEPSTPAKPEARPPLLASLAPLPTARTRGFTPEPQRAPSAEAAVLQPRPVYKIGAPYAVGNRTYVPAEEPDYDAVGRASWYGGSFHGKPTANGEIYDQNALVAAHPTLPMPSYVLVTNLRNGRTVLLRVNNRGPYAEGRIIDVSAEAADLLGFKPYGLAEVRVRYAGRAPLDGRDDRERTHLAAQPWHRAVTTRRSAALAPR